MLGKWRIPKGEIAISEKMLMETSALTEGMALLLGITKAETTIWKISGRNQRDSVEIRLVTKYDAFCEKSQRSRW